MTRRPSTPCPNAAEHTPAPTDYISWHVWATGMGKTHIQTRCPTCNLWKIWVPKQDATKAPR